MDIRQLECFVAVAEELHFRRASVRLGLSQPALSERVSALEHELGARLFFRTTRQVSLTQAGSEFLQDAKRILSDIEKSVSNVVHSAESDLHNVRVSGVDEAISTGVDEVAVACPFCRVMVGDGMVARESDVEVLDVAQVLLRSVKAAQ